jgi:predicted metal-dependent hydrolase
MLALREQTMNVHPMDHIPVRPMKFDFSQNQVADPLWSRTNPEFSMFINALGIHVPHFERFLVKTMRAYRGEVKDEKLLSEVQALIGQEAHHAFNFVKWTEKMAEKYPGLSALDAGAQNYFANAFAKKDKKFHIGFTAGYETFTFLGGMIILNRYEELMQEADPTIRALWVWHQVEEVEHGGVAFDFFKANYPDSEGYRRYMVVYAFLHICWETFKAYRLMLKGERRYLRFKNKVRAWKFFASFARDLARAALPVFSRSYHPRNHPICNAEQNPIAVAWREFYRQDNDVLTLDDNKMAAILKL